MIKSSEVLFALLSVIGFFILAYIVGQAIKFLVQKTTKLNNNVPLYWTLFLGLFFTTSIYAIVCSKGLSILLPVPFLILFLFKRLMAQANGDSAPDNKRVFIFFVVALLTQFSFFLWTLSSFDPEAVKYIAGDYNIYYRMADRLNTLGTEAYNFNLDRTHNVLPSPYHYGDLWFYALIARFVSINPSVTFLVSFTLLSVTFTMGLYEYSFNLFRKYFNTQSSYFYLLIAAGLFAGFQFCFPHFLLKYAEPYTLSIFNWGKVLVLSCSLIGIMILINRKNWFAAAIALAISGLLYINSAPAIFGSFFLLLLLCLLKKQLTFKKWISINAIYILITAIAVVCLYKVVPLLNPAAAADSVKAAPEPLLHGETIGKYIKTTINIFIGGWFQLFTVLPYLLALAVGIFIVNRGMKGILKTCLNVDYSVVFLILLFVCGMGSWAVMHPFSVDTVQFFHNILAPLYAIAIALIVMFIALVVRKKVLIALVTLLAFFSVYLSSQHIFYAWSFSKKEWVSMEQFFKNDNQNTPFINFKSMNELSYWSAKKTDQYIPLNILNYKWHDYHNISMNAPFITATPNSIYASEEIKDIETATFTTYYRKQVQNGDTALPSIISKFITDHNVHFVSVSNDTLLPTYLSALVKDSLRLQTANFTIYRIK